MRATVIRRKLLIVAAAFGFVAISLFVGPGSTTLGSTQTPGQQIADATVAYVKAHSAIDTFQVRVDRVEGDYARSIVTTPDGLNSAAVYLQRQQGGWVGLNIGTAFEPDFFDSYGIPQSLRGP